MEPEVRKALDEVHAVAKSLGIKVVLVGALIMELTPEVRPGYPVHRKTNDADFGVYALDWGSYEKLRTRLTETGYQQDPKIEHRLRRRAVQVDLIPYGEEIAGSGKFTWPNSGLEMTVVGFREVCEAANNKVRGGSLVLPIITVPGFVLLKIIAFLERHEQQDRDYMDDAYDIGYWLENYALGDGEDTRRFDLEAELKSEGVDYDSAGAALLGREVGALASQEARVYMERFLKESGDLYSPFIDALRHNRYGDEDEKERVRIQTRVRTFGLGFRRGRAA